MLWLGEILLLLGLVLGIENEFPEPLNSRQFANMLEDGKLHLVEFYSPYCSYCSHLAPTWKKTWEKGQDLDIISNFNFTLERVNCIESGDLCYDEKIDYFPSFRLYGPSGFIKYYPDDSKKTVDDFIKFVRSASLDISNYEVKGPNDQSIGLTGEAFNNILKNEDLETPYLVSFWPSKLLKSTDDDLEFENCLECLPFQRTWNILTKNLAKKNIKTAHINCKNSASLCNSLGFDDLATIKNHRADRLTRVAMVIPSKMNGGKGNRLVIYNKKYFTDYTEIEDFTLRSLQNVQTEEFPLSKLDGFFQVNPREYLKSYPDEVEAYLVYVCENHDEKDTELLESLVEIASNSEGVQLYKSHPQKFIVTLKNQLAKTVTNLDQNLEGTSENVSDLLTVHNGPGLYYIQKGDIRPYIYPIDKSMNTKKFSENVNKWLTKTNVLAISEVSSWKFNKLLKYDANFSRFIIIHVIDTFNQTKRDMAIKMLGIFNSFLQKYTFKALELFGKNKNLFQKVSSDSTNAEYMRENSQVGAIGTFLELQEAKSFLRKNGLYNSNREYAVGDLMIIDRKSGFFYDSLKNGEILTSTNEDTALNALLSLSSDSSEGVRLEGRLMGSPYPEMLRFMDKIHKHGFFGYIAIILLLVALFNIKFILRLVNPKKVKDGSHSPQKEHKEY